MTKDEALKLALETLEDLMYWDNGKPEFHEASKNIIAIKEALANVPTSDTSEKRVDETAKQRHEQEPVIDKSAAIRIATALGWEPKRTWVGLADEDFLETCQIAERGNYLVAFQRIQAKLKEKNT